MRKNLVLATSLLVLFFMLGGCSNKDSSSESYDSKRPLLTADSSGGLEGIAGTSELKEDSYFKELVNGDQNPLIKLEMLYHSTWKNSEWKNVTWSINQVKIVEVDDFILANGKEYQGLLAVHYTLTNDSKEEVSMYPEKAELTLSSDKKIEASLLLDYWNNTFSAGKEKEGFIYFTLDQVEGLKLATELTMQIKASSKLENTTETHNYSVKLPLKVGGGG